VRIKLSVRINMVHMLAKFIPSSCHALCRANVSRFDASRDESLSRHFLVAASSARPSHLVTMTRTRVLCVAILALWCFLSVHVAGEWHDERACITVALAESRG
jgi:hypothetical protein